MSPAARSAAGRPSARAIARAVGIAAMIALLPACLVVPYPIERHVFPARLERYVGHEAKDAALLRPGETTRDEILLRLGEPDRSIDDGRILVYLGVDLRLGLAVATMFPFVDAGAMPDEDLPGAFVGLALVFDERGVLSRVETPREKDTKISSSAFFEALESIR